MTAEQLELPFDAPLTAPKPKRLPVTAFLVVVDTNGCATATNDLTAPVLVEREANLADIRRACMEVIADIASTQAADTVMMRLNAKPPTQADKIRANLESRKSA